MFSSATTGMVLWRTGNALCSPVDWDGTPSKNERKAFTAQHCTNYIVKTHEFKHTILKLSSVPTGSNNLNKTDHILRSSSISFVFHKWPVIIFIPQNGGIFLNDILPLKPFGNIIFSLSLIYYDMCNRKPVSLSVTKHQRIVNMFWGKLWRLCSDSSRLMLANSQPWCVAQKELAK